MHSAVLEREGPARGRASQQPWSYQHRSAEWLIKFLLSFQSELSHKQQRASLLAANLVSWQPDLIWPRFLPDAGWHAIRAGLAYQMNRIAGGLFSVPPAPSFLISDKNGGARFCIQGPGIKMTPSLERQLLKAESGIELTADITFHLSSAAQNSGKSPALNRILPLPGGAPLLTLFHTS